MVNTPDIAAIATLFGDRARSAMLLSLMSGRALTATELAQAANVSKQTASSHLAKLSEAELVVMERMGRHHYYRLADHRVADTIELLGSLADRVGAAQVVTGPSDDAMRKSRVCYDHLAGDLGVLMLDSMKQRRFVRTMDDALTLTHEGERFVTTFGVPLDALKARRRPLCKSCLDWSVRRPHLAGAVGAAILDVCFAKAWAKKQRGARTVLFSATGELAFRKLFPYRQS